MCGRVRQGEQGDNLLELAIDLISRLAERGEFHATRNAAVPLAVLREHFREVRRSLEEMRTAGLAGLPGADGLFRALRALRSETPSTFRKALGRIAAICTIPQGLRGTLGSEGQRRVFVVNGLYECEQDLLDDLIDGGGYTFEEAERLYHLCLRPITGRGGSEHLAEDLCELMGPGHDGLATVLANLTEEIRTIVLGSPQHVLRALEKGHERIATAQAATMFLKRETFDPRRLAEVAAALPAPNQGMGWLERLAIFASWTSNLALLDACFATRPISTEWLDAHERAWLHLNAAVSYLEHFANATADHGDRILNIAMVSAYGTEGPRASARFSERERDAIFVRASASLAAALSAAPGDPSYYAFMSFVIPATIFMLSRTPSEEVDAFFERFEAVAAGSGRYHSTVYSQNPSPFRMQRVFTTLPANPRNRRTPS